MVKHAPTSIEREFNEIELSVLARRGVRQPRQDTGKALPAPSQLRIRPGLPQPHPLPKAPQSHNAHLVMLHDGRTTIQQHAKQQMGNSNPEDPSKQVQGLGFYGLQGVEYQASQVSSTVDVTVTHAKCCGCAKRWGE